MTEIDKMLSNIRDETYEDVTNCQMNKMNGFQVQRKVRETEVVSIW